MNFSVLNVKIPFLIVIQNVFKNIEVIPWSKQNNTPCISFLNTVYYSQISFISDRSSYFNSFNLVNICFKNKSEGKKI